MPGKLWRKKARKVINLLTKYIQNIIISTCNQQIINEMIYILFFPY